MNFWVGSGRLTKDPAVKYTQRTYEKDGEK